jgi:hypothetical protein
VRARQTHKGRADFIARASLRFVHCRRNGLAGLFNVHHHALAHPARGFETHAQNPQAMFAFDFCDQRADFGGADIKADEKRGVVGHIVDSGWQLAASGWPLGMAIC